MANEATLRYANSDGSGNILQDYTVSGAVAITKGAILKMTDPRTAVLADGDGDVCAGIAARDKVANDGRTRLSVYRQGDFDVIASGAIPIGYPVRKEKQKKKMHLDNCLYFDKWKNKHMVPIRKPEPL